MIAYRLHTAGQWRYKCPTCHATFAVGLIVYRLTQGPQAPPIDVTLPPGDPLPAVELGQWRNGTAIHDARLASDTALSQVPLDHESKD